MPHANQHTHNPSHAGAFAGVRSFLADAMTGFRAAREVRSTISNPQSWLLEYFGGIASKSGASVNENTAFNVSAIRACVDLRANLIAMLPLKLYQRTNRGPVEIKASEHRLAKLIKRRAGPAQTAYQWKHCSQVAFDIGGTSYARIYRNAFAEVEAIRWVPACDIQVKQNEKTGQIVYEYKGERLADYDILRISNLSTNGVTGRSPLADLREAVGLAMTAEEFTARSFANGNRKPGLLVPPAGFTTKQAEEFRAQWLAHYAGAANAGKTPLVGGGMSWQDIGFSNADAELLGIRKFSIEEIARVYHLPLHLIGSTDKATTWGSGIEQLNQGLVDYTLAPLCANWEAEMNTTLLTEAEQDAGYYIKFSVDALLRGSFETRAKVYQVMRGIAAMDVNQIRQLEDWQVYEGEEFSDPRLPMNNQGGGGANAAAKQDGSSKEDDDATKAKADAEAEAKRSKELVDAIRAIPRPEVHVAAPNVTFEKDSIRSETRIEPGAVQVTAAIPAPSARKIVRDESGAIVGTEPV